MCNHAIRDIALVRIYNAVKRVYDHGNSNKENI